MNRSAIVIIIGILSVGTAAGQSDKDTQASEQSSASAVPQNQEVNGSLPSGSPIDAALTKAIDSRKAKQGDPITARTTQAIKDNGKPVLPSGATLVGHVTQASSRSKGDAYSSLGIVFDKAVLKRDQEIPLHVAVQAIARPQSELSASAGPDMNRAPMGAGGASPAGPGRTAGAAGAPGGMASAPSNTVDDVANTVANTDANNAISGKGAVGGLNTAGQLSSNSRGVFGLQGIGLTGATEGTEQAAIITSTGKDVHLDSGTQLLLVTQPATPSAAAKP